MSSQRIEHGLRLSCTNVDKFQTCQKSQTTHLQHKQIIGSNMKITLLQPPVPPNNLLISYNLNRMDILPAVLANFMKVSSIVLSTALRDPGIRLRATAMAPFVSSSVAPGWDSSIFVRNTSNQTKYLPMILYISSYSKAIRNSSELSKYELDAKCCYSKATKHVKEIIIT